MIKRLKTIEQIKSENNCSWDYSYGLTFRDKNGMFDGRILETMFDFFGTFIDVKKYKSETKINYTWKINSDYGHFAFKDDWFESDILKDSLFEI